MVALDSKRRLRADGPGLHVQEYLSLEPPVWHFGFAGMLELRDGLMTSVT